MQFQIFMIGAGQAPVMEVPVGNLAELASELAVSRFLAGELIEADGCDQPRPVLIPVHRIQLVATA